MVDADYGQVLKPKSAMVLKIDYAANCVASIQNLTESD